MMNSVQPVGAVVLFVLAFSPAAEGQNSLVCDSSSGYSGQTVDVSIRLDNDVPLLGFQMGLTHDDALLSLDDIISGQVLEDLNDGTGPSFFEFDLDATGGPGGWVACITT